MMGVETRHPLSANQVLELLVADGCTWPAPAEDAGEHPEAGSPDLHGLAATGATVEECVREMEAAVAFHLDGLREEGAPIPPPVSRAAYVEVEPPAAR